MPTPVASLRMQLVMTRAVSDHPITRRNQGRRLADTGLEMTPEPFSRPRCFKRFLSAPSALSTSRLQSVSIRRGDIVAVRSRISLKLFLLIASLVLFGLPDAFSRDGKPKYTGTFTSLEYNEEGGDLLGEELRIVLAKKGYQATLQIAEGEPSQLMVVDVQFDKNKLNFVIPDSYPVYGGGIFEGTIDLSGIRGVLKFKGGGSDPVRWKRGRSYWDK